MGFVVATLFIRPRMGSSTVDDGNLYAGLIFYACAHMLFDGACSPLVIPLPQRHLICVPWLNVSCTVALCLVCRGCVFVSPWLCLCFQRRFCSCFQSLCGHEVFLDSHPNVWEDPAINITVLLTFWMALSTGFTEMALQIESLPVFFKQRDNLFFPGTTLIADGVLCRGRLLALSPPSRARGDVIRFDCQRV